MDLKSGLITARTTGAIGWLTFDNPSKLNALSPGMSEDALTVIEAYEADPAIKVVIMRGAGREGLHLRRRHLELREDAQRRRSGRARAQDSGRAGAQDDRHQQAADRDDPRLLPRRRSRHGAERRPAFRVVGCAVRHSCRAARRRLSAGGLEEAGRSGRTELSPRTSCSRRAGSMPRRRCGSG